MQAPFEVTLKPYRPPLELRKISLYATGVRGKVYTDHFYKSMNHNFGIEMVLQNNTSKTQTVKIGGCVYDMEGNTVIKWGATKQLLANCQSTQDFYVREETFSELKVGKYKVQFWINDKKVQRDFFTITYK